MHSDVVDVDGPRKKPKKDVADDFAIRFSENRAGTGDLKFLAKETGAPGKSKRTSLNHHYLIEVGDGHRSEPHAIAGRQKATGVILDPWLLCQV
jgi:hypothetical protein